MEYESILFNDIINNYDMNIKELKMKEDHTYRVVEYAKEIAKSLNLSDEDIRLACICALFHDIGRFPQYSEYKTYHDSLSFDHGDKGYDMLKDLEYNDEIVLKTVKYHNKYCIPDNLSEREKLFCNITRDADKLDILLYNLITIRDEECFISDDVYQSLFSHEMVKNDCQCEKSDVFEILRSIGFIYDINFPKSFSILYDSKIIEKKIEYIYNNFWDARLMLLNAVTKKYMQERVDNNVREKIRSRVS